MKKPLSLSKFLALGSILALGGTYAGCADPDSEMYIRGVLRFPTTGECVVKADQDATQLLEGELDNALSTEYRAVLLVANQLVQTDRAPDEKQRTETSRVAVHTAEVSLNVPGDCDDTGLCEVSAFSLPASGSIDNSTGGRPAFGLVYVTIVDPATAKKASGKTLTAKIRLFGRALGGQEVRSNEFQFNVRVSNTELIYYDPSYDDPLIPGPDCTKDPGASAGTAPFTTCVFGQDGSTHCALCSSFNPKCRCKNTAASPACAIE